MVCGILNDGDIAAVHGCKQCSDLRRVSVKLVCNRQGQSALLASQSLLALLTGVAISNGAVEALRTLAPTLSSRALGAETSSAGILVTAFSVGATTGLLCFSWISRRMRPDRVLQMSFLGQAIGLFVNTYGFDKAVAERLVANGINSPAAFEGVEAADLVGFGFTEEEAAGLIAKVSGS